MPNSCSDNSQPNSKLASTNTPIRLICLYKNYPWGKMITDSKVYDLIEPTIKAKADKSLPYAELWMGTHPNAPSFLFEPDGSEGELLKDLIASNPVQYLGSEVFSKFGNDLPFLFKVLSVSQALSIQAHPDKELSIKLHREQPDIYKDPNHKPEMAIALSSFEALCGFRPISEIILFLQKVPEFSELLGKQAMADLLDSGLDSKERMRRVFVTLMTCPTELVENKVVDLIKRIQNKPGLLEKEVEELVLRLNSQFPKDIGIFCVFVLNYLKLEPGQAIYLGANEPHAYLYGDCVECMATSDNVIRAGLTHKFKDVDTLVNMLNYNSRPLKEQIMVGQPCEGRPHTLLYDPPIIEFSVMSISLDGPNIVEEGGQVNGPGILIIVSSPDNAKLVCKAGTFPLLKGNTFFIPPTSPFSISTNNVTQFSPLLAFFAFCKL